MQTKSVLNGPNPAKVLRDVATTGADGAGDSGGGDKLNNLAIHKEAAATAVVIEASDKRSALEFQADACNQVMSAMMAVVVPVASTLSLAAAAVSTSQSRHRDQRLRHQAASLSKAACFHQPKKLRSQRVRWHTLCAVDAAVAAEAQAPVQETRIADVTEAQPSTAGVTAPPAYDLQTEVGRRRNFAIISHPDAGKTTLTEKLLLYGGAIHEAGAVKARRAARHATSDWMELEKARGISITSTCMQFGFKGVQINLLDTPGHQDFGEDTTLAAADNAVMLVDAAKGLEPQTRKLFEVCRMRQLPVFTFVNKLDRPSLEPLELLDQIEKEFNLPTYAVNWPIGSGDRFMGVYHRPTSEVHLFERALNHGSREAVANVLPKDDPRLQELIPEELLLQLQEELELLDSVSPPLDLDEVAAGQLTPVFFGSAMNNFGVQLFLESFLDYAVAPGAHESIDGDEILPDDPHFTGFVFKLQANMDPKHRDKIAFLRVCSGVFERGMKVQIARTGKSIALTRPQKLFAQERSTVDTGFAGDVIGLNNPGAFAIGDTIYCGPKRTYPGIPTFSPELFAYLRNLTPSKYKQFQKGISELLGEGAVQALYSMDDRRTDPIVAAVGQLQFEVVQYRLQSEYGVETQLDPLPYTVARWVNAGWPAVEKAGRLFNCVVAKDAYNRPVLLFRNTWNVDQLLTEKPEIGELSNCALPPSS
eukprot:jgi/Chlat1/2282/Chrsp17S02795